MAMLDWMLAPYLHEFLHGGWRILLGRALDEDIVLGPHKPANGVACILRADTLNENLGNSAAGTT